MTNLFAKGFQLSTECKVSLQRLESFLSMNDINLIKDSEGVPSPIIASLNDPSVSVYLKNASFSWKETKPNVKLGSKGSNLLILKDISLTIHKGELVGVCGPVGCGKSSLINALLGELECVEGKIGLRSRNIAYVSQTPWILAGTFQDNILFGQPLREEWFHEVVKACALDIDFAKFPDKEHSYVEERGTNLSGGQKTRLALARAVYANADIYLLDDPLSAVDPKVGKHLFNYCICGLLRKKVY